MDNGFEKLEILGKEVDKLREKSHTLSNMTTDHEGRLTTLERDQEATDEDVRSLDKTLATLAAQNKMLKWFVGASLTVCGTVFLEYVKML